MGIYLGYTSKIKVVKYEYVQWLCNTSRLYNYRSSETAVFKFSDVLEDKKKYFSVLKFYYDFQNDQKISCMKVHYMKNNTQ